MTGSPGASGFTLRRPAGSLGFVAVPAAMVSRHERRDSAFRRLIAMLAERADLIVATHAATLEEVRTWTGAARSARTVAIDDGIDFTCWAQDACLPAADANAREVLLLSPSAAKRADRIVVEAVAREAGLEVVEAPFDFEGGQRAGRP